MNDDRVFPPRRAEAPLGYHVTFSLSSRKVLAERVADRRLAARIVHRIGARGELLSFGIADTHGHLALGPDRRLAGRIVHDIEVAFRHRLGLASPFAAAHFTPLMDQRHLENAARYSFTQRTHHGLDDDPFFDSSSLSDFLGLRVLGNDEPLRRMLPRLRPAELWKSVEWATGQPPELDGAIVVCHLADAAAAAVGLADLHGRAADSARRAAVHVAKGHLTTSEIAAVIDTDPRTVRRLAQLPADERVVCAIRTQVRARAWHQRQIIVASDALAALGEMTPVHP